MIILYIDLVAAALCSLLHFALHVTGSGSFPKPLTAKEERACLEKIRNGDSKAKNVLIEHNLRLVAHIVKKYYAVSGEQDDLISIGTIGLIKAAGTFDYEKGIRFATYASRCIENEILMTFRSKRKSAGDVYISDPIDTDKDGNSLTLMDLMYEEQDLVGILDLQMRSKQLYRYLDENLDPREQKIIVLRYGLHNRPPLTQREVAKQLDISRSYVSRLEKSALSKLRRAFETEGTS